MEAQQSEDWDPVAETLLFAAARVQHWRQKIQPALDLGQWVLCDRFVDSTVMYQGLGKGLGAEFVLALHRLTLANAMPDFTLVLDIPVELGLQRAKSRGGAEQRFEGLDTAFHHRLREGFLELVEAEPHRVQRVDAQGAVEDVHRRICEAMAKRFGLTLL